MKESNKNFYSFKSQIITQQKIVAACGLRGRMISSAKGLPDPKDFGVRPGLYTTEIQVAYGFQR